MNIISIASGVVARWCPDVDVLLERLENAPGEAPSLSSTDCRSWIKVDPLAVAGLSGEQIEQLALHEVAHVLAERVPCAMASVAFGERCHWRGIIHAHCCDCRLETTGHCIHWRRIARAIGYLDAFTFANPGEEREPLSRRRRYLTARRARA